MNFPKVILLALLVIILGCSTPAKPPVLANAKDTPARQALYEQYRLTEDRGFWSHTWSRADGKYEWGQLSDLAAQFPESESIYNRVLTRGLILGSIGGAGGGIVGYTLGYNLTASEGNRMSSNAQIALYATGGGLVLVSALVGLLWPNPADQFAETYNGALRKGLRLDKTRGTIRRLTSERPPWVPVLLTSTGEAGWRF